MTEWEEVQEKWAGTVKEALEYDWYRLNRVQVIHIIKKLLQMPTHLSRGTEREIAKGILKALGIEEIRGDIETLFKEFGP